MKTIINTLLTTIILVFVVMACQPKKTEQADSEIQQKVNAYASFELKADLNRLSANEKKMIPILIEAADIMNEIFWKQTYGDKESLMAQITDPSVKQFVEINYGPWERLAANQSFVEGIGPKFPGAQFYPADMTKEEFEESDAPDKTSLYTMIRRGKDGKLISIPYHTFFNEEVTRAADLIRQAAELAEDEGLKRYLTLRVDALLNDDYYPSDIAWMEMKTNNIDFVIGPIENYEDALFGYKAAYEGFVLVKDQEWSSKLARFAALLPTLQLTLPVTDEYKKEVPGSDSDLGVYEALYYAGDCNSGSKTIAINLPNDERVQIEKGSRKLQLKNSMRAKFEKILLPISAELINPDQQKHIGFDAFFENVMFHEVSHGLGIKNTINGMGSVRKALSEQYSPIEEAKADILGLYLVSQLAEMGELGEKDLMDNYVTFIAGIFRSVRFGATSSHGKGNMLQFNYFLENKAFTRDETTGHYTINFDQMKVAVNDLAALILTLQGDGNYQGVKDLMSEKGVVPEVLQKDLDRINSLGIPKDIVFKQGVSVLGL